MDVVAAVTAGLLGLLFGFHAIMVLRAHPMQRQTADTLKVSYDRYRLVAIPEGLAAVGLFIGIVVRPLAFAAAAGLTVLMLGAMILRLRVRDEGKHVIADLVLALVCAAVAVVQFAAR